MIKPLPQLQENSPSRIWDVLMLTTKENRAKERSSRKNLKSLFGPWRSKRLKRMKINKWINFWTFSNITRCRIFLKIMKSSSFLETSKTKYPRWSSRMIGRKKRQSVSVKPEELKPKARKMINIRPFLLEFLRADRSPVKKLKVAIFPCRKVGRTKDKTKVAKRMG